MSNCLTDRGPLSPKKRVHSFRGESLTETVDHVRRDLANAKDISARNLMAHCNHLDSSESKTGDSSDEEVVAIEEVTEYSENSEEQEYEVIEEVIEESYSSSDESDELKPLPPPIKIPKALQVRDDDENRRNSDDDDSSSNGSSSEDDDEDEVDVKLGRPSRKESIKSPAPLPERQVLIDPKSRPDRLRGFSYMDENTSTSNKKPEKKTEKPSSTVAHAVPTPPVLTTTATTSSNSNIQEEEEEKGNDGDRLSWQKPDWTKNAKLKSTGKSATDNLAKPITNLPHMNRNCDTNTSVSISMPNTKESHKSATATCSTTTKTTATKPTKSKVSKSNRKETTPSSQTKSVLTICSTPTMTAPKKKVTAAPKSAPSAPRPKITASPPVAAAVDDHNFPKIEWEKPEWTKKTVLRNTSKGSKLKEGQEISRPIGGIRPLDWDASDARGVHNMHCKLFID